MACNKVIVCACALFVHCYGLCMEVGGNKSRPASQQRNPRLKKLTDNGVEHICAEIVLTGFLEPRMRSVKSIVLDTLYFLLSNSVCLCHLYLPTLSFYPR